ncbi:C-factor [Dentipellis sp. KUC8613]|nr:C-factor [Dentipellis sp. KUC8613]
MSDTTTWLITGTNRGIGLEFVKQVLQSPSNIVIAACRNPTAADALKTLAASYPDRLHITTIDIGDAESIKASVEPVKSLLEEKGLDYLVNNAAITEGNDSAFGMSLDGLMRSFKINVAGPALVSQAYLPYLLKGRRKVIMSFTSGIASIGLDYGAKNASYSISKTALNMLTYKQATERPDVIAFVVDPGWVKTDMGGEGAMIEAQESVSHLLKLITGATQESSGKFFRYTGEVLPW